MTDGVLEPPRRLARSDERDGFRCGAPEADTWFREYAWQNQRAGNAVVYVTVQDGAPLGYYAIAMASYAQVDAPETLARHRPREIPMILLARLAVDERAQGRGVGAALLKDAIQRSLALGEAIASAALLIHCRDDDAKRFYLANADFLESPANSMHLLLPLKKIRWMLAAG